MDSLKYQDFLVSRLLIVNKFGSAEKFIQAIQKAKSINDESERQEAIKEIHRLAPMRHDQMLASVLYVDVPDWLDQEVAAFCKFFEN